jgi:hypothetical protein
MTCSLRPRRQDRGRQPPDNAQGPHRALAAPGNPASSRPGGSSENFLEVGPHGILRLKKRGAVVTQRKSPQIYGGIRFAGKTAAQQKPRAVPDEPLNRPETKVLAPQSSQRAQKKAELGWHRSLSPWCNCPLAVVWHGEMQMNKPLDSLILTIRDQKVILDLDLAELYGVPTKALNQAIKRNTERFPPDFMFQLTEAEKSEVVTNCDHLSRLKFSRTRPFAFTEHGALMAANVLNSSQSVKMSVYVVRAFIKQRELLMA